MTANVRRIVADNPGPMTFTGTCTYVVGHGEVAIIDPGPDLADHRSALLQALRNEMVRLFSSPIAMAIIAPSAAALKRRRARGFRLRACARTNRDCGRSTGRSIPRMIFLMRPMLSSAMARSSTLRGITFEAVATPGHTGNHLSFALREEASLFTGDHVMAWSTSVVIPPDGAMADYRRSLEKLLFRDETLYWPGHGGPVRDPKPYVAALIQHQGEREAAILRRAQIGIGHRQGDRGAGLWAAVAADRSRPHKNRCWRIFWIWPSAASSASKRRGRPIIPMRRSGVSI